jgi:hypothetical protein
MLQHATTGYPSEIIRGGAAILGERGWIGAGGVLISDQGEECAF